MDWITYEPEGDYIHPSRWGRDHWTTLLYLETRAVDHAGNINSANMRCNARLHRMFFARLIVGDKDYPTRLAGGEVVEKHDDWSCAEDFVAAGLITLEWRRVNDDAFGNSVGRVKLTELGWQVAHQLRRHKADGNASASFVWIQEEQPA